MSNGPSNPVNLTRIASKSLAGGHAPLPGPGEAAKKDADKYKPITEHTVVKRALPVLEPAPGDEEPEAAGSGSAPPVDAAVEKDRHTKWREAQESKRAARTQANIDAAAKRQVLAKELLGKGDLAGASKALGIPASELVTLVNQAALGMKPDEPAPKKLTPEEQRTADETAFREEMKAFRKEQEDFRNHQAMSGFIEKNLSPVLVDKDAYEMIHAAGRADIETYAYRYMNQHYYDTSEKDAAGKITKPGEILNAKDVLDAIEENLVKAQEATLDRARALKKVSKYFAPAGAAALAEAVAASREETSATPLSASRRARIAEAMAEEEAERAPAAPGGALAAAEPETPAGDPAAPKIVRPSAAGANIRAVNLGGGRLTAAAKLARIREEDEAAAKASRR